MQWESCCPQAPLFLSFYGVEATSIQCNEILGICFEFGGDIDPPSILIFILFTVRRERERREMFGCKCFCWGGRYDSLSPEPEPFSLPAPIPQWPEGTDSSNSWFGCRFWNLGFGFVWYSDMGFDLFVVGLCFLLLMGCFEFICGFPYGWISPPLPFLGNGFFFFFFWVSGLEEQVQMLVLIRLRVSVFLCFIGFMCSSFGAVGYL